MTNHSKYSTFLTPIGVAIRPAIFEPDRTFDDDGVYRVGLAVAPNAEGLTGFVDYLEEIRKKGLLQELPRRRHLFRPAPVYEPHPDDGSNETGGLVFRFRLKALVRPRNEPAWTQQPDVFDDQNEPLKLLSEVGEGSRVRVAGDAVPYSMRNGMLYGVALRMRAVQVITLLGGRGRTGASYGFTVIA